MVNAPETLFPLMSKSGYWGYINSGGSWVIAPKFSQAYRFNEQRAVVKIDKKYHIINMQGEMVTEKGFDECGGFSDQRCAVEVMDKWGYIDLDGEYVVEPQFREAKDYSEGLAAVDICWDEWDSSYGYLDIYGNFVMSPCFSLASQFAEDLAYVIGKKGNDGSRKGYINKKGEYVIDLEGCQDCRAFSEGLAPASISGHYGLINRKGNWVVPPDYDFIGSFCEGMARVQKGNNWGFLDNSGNLKISFQYGFVDDFSEGLAVFSHDALLVRDQSSRPINIDKNRKFGFINNEGKNVIEPLYDKAEKFISGLAWVKVQEQFNGYIKKDGNFAAYTKFDYS